MTDRPIIFSAPMIRALFDGRKTRTRRIIKPQPISAEEARRGPFAGPMYSNDVVWPLGHGRAVISNKPGPHPTWVKKWVTMNAGDRLWVRENFARVPITAYRMSDGVQQTTNPNDPDEAAIYAAGWERSKPSWKPSIHMPRWASRLTLIIESVKVERLQDISEDDAKAEGVEATDYWREDHPASICFSVLWESINGRGSWGANPWVAAITFRCIKANIDTIEKEAA